LLALPVGVLLGACGFSDRNFDDAEFARLSAGGGAQAGSSVGGAGSGAGGSSEGGAGSGGKSGEAGNGGSSAGAGGNAAGKGGAGTGGAGQSGEGGGGTSGEGGAGASGEGGAGSSGEGGGGTSGEGGAGTGGAGTGGAGQGGAGQGGAGTGGTSGTGGSGGAPCLHDECTIGDKLTLSCSSCAETVCTAFPACCNSAWGSGCVAQAKTLCGACGGGTGGAGAGGAAGTGGAGTGGAGTGGAGQGGAGQGGAGQGGTTGGSGGTTAGTGGTGGAGTGGTGGTGGSGTTCGIGAPGADCLSTCDCGSSQLCNKPVFTAPGKSVCSKAGVGAKALGVSCLKNTECVSGYCDIFSFTCTEFCKTDADCASGTTACYQALYVAQTSGWSPNICLLSCDRNEDCPPNSGGTPICFLSSNLDGDYTSGACTWVGVSKAQNPAVIATFGQEPYDSTTQFCETGFSLSLKNPVKDICSKGCITDADCAAPYPKCAIITATNPSGVGFQNIKSCSP
jgi:hypothetical protein